MHLVFAMKMLLSTNIICSFLLFEIASAAVFHVHAVWLRQSSPHPGANLLNFHNRALIATISVGRPGKIQIVRFGSK
jgi:hypothetical protein